MTDREREVGQLLTDIQWLKNWFVQLDRKLDAALSAQPALCEQHRAEIYREVARLRAEIREDIDEQKQRSAVLGSKLGGIVAGVSVASSAATLVLREFVSWAFTKLGG